MDAAIRIVRSVRVIKRDAPDITASRTLRLRAPCSRTLQNGVDTGHLGWCCVFLHRLGAGSWLFSGTQSRISGVSPPPGEDSKGSVTSGPAQPSPLPQDSSCASSRHPGRLEKVAPCGEASSRGWSWQLLPSRPRPRRAPRARGDARVATGLLPGGQLSMARPERLLGGELPPAGAVARRQARDLRTRGAIAAVRRGRATGSRSS